MIPILELHHTGQRFDKQVIRLMFNRIAHTIYGVTAVDTRWLTHLVPRRHTSPKIRPTRESELGSVGFAALL